MGEQTKNIVPLYAAKVRDLNHADMVTALCTCGHRGTVAVAAIKRVMPGYTPLKAIKHKLRCRVCNTTGEAEIDARAALGHDRSS